jgi:cell division protein FtsL
MNPDTLQLIQNILLASSALLLSLIIARLLMGYTKHTINMLIVIFLCTVGIVYLDHNKEYYTKKYEAELVNTILFNRVKDTLKVQLPK